MEYLWEAKNLVNKVKHAVLNLTEMESKVMDATNDDKWGASSTLMLDIARGTMHFQQFNEVMNILVKRLTERDPSNWRKVYKGLTLLEYLIKNGSEKVVDFSRANLSLIKSLRSFQCIDDRGKDQGINVRNRAKEIVELLGSTDRIKEERRRAKANRTKYVGIGSDPSGFGSGGFSSGSSTPSRFGSSFAREELGGGLDFEDEPAPVSRFDDSPKPAAAPLPPVPEPPLPPTPAVDLFSFDDPPASVATTTGAVADDDEWSDFQGSSSAGPSQNASTSRNGGFSDDVEFGDFQSVTTKHPNHLPVAASLANRTQPPPLNTNNNNTMDLFATLPLATPPVSAASAPSVPSSQKIELDSNDLWGRHANLLSLDNLSLTPQPSTNNSNKLSMNQMAQQKQQQQPNANANFLPPQFAPLTPTPTSHTNGTTTTTTGTTTSARPLAASDLSEFDSLI